MFPGRLQTKYFDIRYRQHPEQIAELGRFADAYIELVNRDFFYAEFRYPIRILVLENQRTLDNFLRVQFHEAPALGIYLPNYGVLATHENAGLGTLAHEIMHPLVEANLRDRPMWSFEGIPSFFEKFYGFWSKNELAIEWGYQNPWRVASWETGSRIST